MYEIDSQGNKDFLVPSVFCRNVFFIGKDSCNSWYNFHITDDLKYVYRVYLGELIIYRVTNISSKPILDRSNKIAKWHKISEQIDRLKEERAKLGLRS